MLTSAPAPGVTNLPVVAAQATPVPTTPALAVTPTHVPAVQATAAPTLAAPTSTPGPTATPAPPQLTWLAEIESNVPGDPGWQKLTIRLAVANRTAVPIEVGIYSTPGVSIKEGRNYQAPPRTGLAFAQVRIPPGVTLCSGGVGYGPPKPVVFDVMVPQGTEAVTFIGEPGIRADLVSGSVVKACTNDFAAFPQSPASVAFAQKQSDGSTIQVGELVIQSFSSRSANNAWGRQQEILVVQMELRNADKFASLDLMNLMKSGIWVIGNDGMVRYLFSFGVIELSNTCYLYSPMAGGVRWAPTAGPSQSTNFEVCFDLADGSGLSDVGALVIDTGDNVAMVRP